MLRQCWSQRNASFKIQFQFSEIISFNFLRSQHVMEENVAIALTTLRDNRFAVITFHTISHLISSFDSDCFVDSDEMETDPLT